MKKPMYIPTRKMEPEDSRKESVREILKESDERVREYFERERQDRTVKRSSNSKRSVP